MSTLPATAGPIASGLSASQIAMIAGSVARQVGYEPGSDLEPIVRRMGGRITHVDLLGGEASDSGSIEISDNSFEIRLALATGPLRDRFTIAHELGHFVLHYLYRKQNLNDDVRHLVAQRFGSSQAEKEANWFAAAFLMPTDAFKAEYKATDGDHFALSRKFGVSTAASKVRALALGLESQHG